MYAKVAHYIKSRKDFTEESLEGLEEIIMDAGKCKAILDASKSSMGMFLFLVNTTRYYFQNKRNDNCG